MKKRLLLFGSFLLIVSLFASCSFKKNENNITNPMGGSGKVTFNGQVVDNSSGDAIEGAVIHVAIDTTTQGVLTDSDGKFNLALTLSKGGDLNLIAFKEGYIPDTIHVFAVIDQTINVPTIRLKASSVIPATSGSPASIDLFSQSANSVGVKETGAVESATFIFQVKDSSGYPINSDSAVDVSFEFGGTAGGGEYLFPTHDKTNADGKVSVTLNSGTKAGVIQLIAKFTWKNKVIQSKPIPFTIYSGFPVQERFAVASDKLNYPYLGVLNKEISFVALLGDKYSNPVRENTAVYFSTTSGVIGRFVYTDDLGRAKSTLATFGNPNLPNDGSSPYWGPGFFKVTAKTITETADTISTYTIRLLSGDPVLSNLNPTSFALDNGGSQTFTFSITDVNGNPISSDNSISFNAQGGTLTASPTSYSIPDALTGGANITDFKVTIGDSDPKTDELKNSTLIITVSGPRGTFSYTIFGTSR